MDIKPGEITDILKRENEDLRALVMELNKSVRFLTGVVTDRGALEIMKIYDPLERGESI